LNPKPNSKQAIAQACGVNLATVSLALNNHARVAERTRLRIQEVARRLGYVPNHAARQLARSRFQRQGRSVERVGLVLFDGGEPLRGVYMAFLTGVEQRVSALGGMLVFVRETAKSPRGRFSGFARSEVVDGLALLGVADDKALRQAKKAGLPMVVIGDNHSSKPVHQVCVDYRAMGRMAVQHLLALGHRRIGFIADRLFHIYQREIAEGAQAAMAEAGLVLQLEVWNIGKTPDEIQPALRDPIDSFRASGTTAVLVGEPGRAGVFIDRLAQKGLRVPDDISVVACELSDAKPDSPGMTCVDASMEEVGAIGVDLLREVARTPNGPARSILVPPRLVEGKTCRRIAQQTGEAL
jgi:LacI family transcriptional regulator